MEITLFIKELHLHSQNTNEVDDETLKLLAEVIVAANKLQINSRLLESIPTAENNFVDHINDGVFEFRRYIVCRLCHVSVKKIFV